MKTELIAGKRYMWPVTNIPSSRMVNGLFTGEYKENGNAVLQCKNGEIWTVPPQNCSPIPRKEK